MTIIHINSRSSVEEIAAEMDRRGLVIEQIEAERDRLRSALELFMRQWNACGPNSDFGRYFSNVRDAANAALAPRTHP